MTVRAITTAELAKFQAGGQYSEVFVIPRVPNVIYSARLATVPASHDMVASIAITDGVGDIVDVRLDMKILVSSLAAGGDDIGFCRVRELPDVDLYGDGTLYIGELSHINWQSDCYITIVDDYDIFPRPIRIVRSEAFIDWGVNYDHQHEDFDPIVNMGGHRVLFLDPDTGLVSHIRNCTDEGSMVFDGTITDYLWESPNALSITGDDTEEATFEYDTPGHFVEYCTLATDGGALFTGVRYVFIVDPEALESNIHSLKIDESKDGISISFDMTTNAKLTDFRYRAFVIAFSIDYYGGVKETVSYRTYEGNILGSGRISGEQLEFNDETGLVRFSAGDFKYWMGKISAFPFGLERATKTPTVWTSMPGLNVDRAVWELLHRYCTVSRLADIHLSGDQRYAEELASTSSTLLAQLEEITLTTIYADLVFDIFGVGWLREEPQLTINRTGIPLIQAISSDDWQDNLSIELNTYDEMSQMNSSGVSVAQFGSAVARISLSYGHIFSPFGDSSTTSNLLLGTQSHSNSIAGLFMGWNNRRFDEVSINFIGNNRMFSLAEYCHASINITAISNPRGISYNGFIIPQSISRSWEAGSGFLNTEISFQDESIEQPSTKGDFPPDTGIEDEDFPVFPSPSFPIPTLPPVILPPVEENLSKPKTLVIATSLGVLFTENADADTEAEIVWMYMNDGLTALEQSGIADMVVTPAGQIYILTLGSTYYGFDKVMVANGLGSTWSTLVEYTDFDTEYSTFGSRIWGIGINPLENDSIAVMGGREWAYPDYGYFRIALGGSSGLTFPANGKGNLRKGLAKLIYTNGGWTLFHNQTAGFLGTEIHSFVTRLTTGGDYVTETDVNSSYNAGEAHPACSSGTQDVVFDWTSVLRKGTANGTVFVVQSISPSGMQGVSFSPTGLCGMACTGIIFTPMKTTDGGATWVSAAGVIPVGLDVWENCRDDNRWVFGGGSTIRATITHGADYYNISGNLYYIAAAADISNIRFIE